MAIDRNGWLIDDLYKNLLDIELRFWLAKKELGEKVSIEKTEFYQ